MFQLNQSNIRNINIVEKDGVADVEMTLADGPVLDDAEEYLVLSVQVEYRGYFQIVEQVKKRALARARSVIANEISRIQELENQNT